MYVLYDATSTASHMCRPSLAKQSLHNRAVINLYCLWIYIQFTRKSQEVEIISDAGRETITSCAE